jgi:hypothetical protein
MHFVARIELWGGYREDKLVLCITMGRPLGGSAQTTGQAMALNI